MIWIPCPAFPDYEVSDQGDVRRCWAPNGRTSIGKVLSVNWSGGRERQYGSVLLRRNGASIRKYVHRLVCEAFHGPVPFDGAVVDHIDGDTTRNVASNLRWLSNGANVSRGGAGKHQNHARGSSHGQAKLTEAKVKAMREEHAEGATFAALGRKFGVSGVNVAAAVRRETWMHVD